MNIVYSNIVQMSSNELLALLVSRARAPRSHEPWPDDQKNEHPLEVFVRCAVADTSGALDAGLQKAVSAFFESSDSDNVEDPAVEALIILAQHRAIAGAAPSLKAWLLRNQRTLEETFRDLGNEAIETMASLAPRNHQHWIQFFVELWQRCPNQWAPSLFKAIRLSSLDTACTLLPELFVRAAQQGASPDELLVALWREYGGPDAVIRWAQAAEPQWPNKLREVIESRLPQSERPQLKRLARNRSIFAGRPKGVMPKMSLRVAQQEAA